MCLSTARLIIADHAQAFNSCSDCFAALPSFTLIPQHTSPDLAVAETDALYDVVTDVRTRWNTNVNKLKVKACGPNA